MNPMQLLTQDMLILMIANSFMSVSMARSPEGTDASWDKHLMKKRSFVNGLDLCQIGKEISLMLGDENFQLSIF